MNRPNLNLVQSSSTNKQGQQTVKPDQGKVYLLGAGPGDPELMTIKGMRLLQRADVIVYDRLANPELLEYAKAECECIYVGKRKDQHSLPQEDICDLLVKHSQQGKMVVRLKGGDPFIFGRGGEEIDVLRDHSIECEVIPGITAATGCAAATQIPLTHRDHAHAVTFITGHRRNDKLSINWDLALQQDSTVVFYMGLSNLDEIARELIARGCPGSKPIAVVSEGTHAEQREVVGTLASIAAQVKRKKLPSPALIILGDVVKANGYLQNKIPHQASELFSPNTATQPF